MLIKNYLAGAITIEDQASHHQVKIPCSLSVTYLNQIMSFSYYEYHISFGSSIPPIVSNLSVKLKHQHQKYMKIINDVRITVKGGHSIKKNLATQHTSISKEKKNKKVLEMLLCFS